MYTLATGDILRKFLVGFDDLLNEKLEEEYQFNCYLVCINNKFKKLNSRKQSAPCWSGQYRCLYSSCDIKYSIILQEKKSSFNITYDRFGWHDRISKTVRCTGSQRQDQKLQLMVSGTANSLNNNVIFNHENPKKPSN